MSTNYLTCPSCQSDRLCVKDRRGIWRRRECLDCGTRLSTHEWIISSYEPLHRAKLVGQMALPL